MTVAEPVAPHSSLNAVKSFVIVTPPQSSSAVTSASQAFNSLVLPSPSHSTVRSSGIVVKTGAVVSTMVKVAVVVVVLPQSSVAVQVTIAEPVAPHSSLNAVKSFVMVTSPQASVAATPASQLLSFDVLPKPSHSTVRFCGIWVNTGGTKSAIPKEAEAVASFPQRSTAVQVTRVSPVPPHSSVKPVKSLVRNTVPQLSESVMLANQALNSSQLPSPSHSTMRSGGT